MKLLLLILMTALSASAATPVATLIREARQSLWKGDTDRAERVLTQALRTQPSNAEARKLLEWTFHQRNLTEAKRLTRRREWTAAEAATRRAIGFRDTPEARKLLQSIATGRRDSAVAARFETLVAEARQALEAHDYDATEEKYRAALRILPADADATIGLQTVVARRQSTILLTASMTAIAHSLTEQNWKAASTQMKAAAQESARSGATLPADPLFAISLAHAKADHAAASKLAREAAAQGSAPAAAWLRMEAAGRRNAAVHNWLPAVSGAWAVSAILTLWAGIGRMRREATA